MNNQTRNVRFSSLAGTVVIAYPSGAVRVSPISTSSAAESHFRMIQREFPNRRAVLLVDGWPREYCGRAMSHLEIDESLFSSGLI